MVLDLEVEVRAESHWIPKDSNLLATTHLVSYLDVAVSLDVSVEAVNGLGNSIDLMLDDNHVHIVTAVL